MLCDVMDDMSIFGRIPQEIELLVPGQRIIIAGRRGTFVGYAHMKSFPHCIRWLPDNSLEILFGIWSRNNKTLSSWDDNEQIFDMAYWESMYRLP